MSNVERTDFPILFKKKNDKLRIWQTWVEGATIYVRYGEDKGKLQTTKDTILSGKNLGKSNETTAEQQAFLEAQSKWNAKLEKEGYCQQENLNKEQTLIVPMLAQDFNDFPHKLTFPCYGQPKLDGARAIHQNGILHSKQRKPWVAVQYLADAINKLNLPYSTDGELYNHELKDDFETLVGSARKDEPLTFEQANLQYHIYDLVVANPQYDRTELLLALQPQIDALNLGHLIKIVETVELHNLAEVEKYLKDKLAQGYEGIMLRNKNGLYAQDHRSYDLLKYKLFIDKEFPIVDVEEGRAKLKGCVGAFILRLPNGDTFKAKLKATDAYLKELFENPVLWKNKMATVQYVRLTKYGVPKPAVAVAIRDYE